MLISKDRKDGQYGVFLPLISRISRVFFVKYYAAKKCIAVTVFRQIVLRLRGVCLFFAVLGCSGSPQVPVMKASPKKHAQFKNRVKKKQPYAI